LTPANWYPSACSAHTIRACKLREALGKWEVETSGALGISSKTCAESGKERRRATKAPPAETFKAVANSSNSLSFSSLLRTKIGIASGRRSHFRRSVSGFRGLKLSPSAPDADGLVAHSGPYTRRPPCTVALWKRNALSALRKWHERNVLRGCIFRFLFVCCHPTVARISTFDCILLPISDSRIAHFPLTPRKPCHTIRLKHSLSRKSECSPPSN
jgi:hypothetical protein